LIEIIINAITVPSIGKRAEISIVGDKTILRFPGKFHAEKFALVVFGEGAGLPLPDGLLLTGGAGVVNVETVVSLDLKIDFVSFHNPTIIHFLKLIKQLIYLSFLK